MTDLLNKDRVLGADMVLQEIRQFRKLAPLGLSDLEMAHRMALSVYEVRKYRGLIGNASKRLKDMDLSYHLRLMLGEQGIATIGDLLSWTDKQLLALHGIGPKRLDIIKRAVCANMGVE